MTYWFLSKKEVVDNEEEVFPWCHNHLGVWQWPDITQMISRNRLNPHRNSLSPPPLQGCWQCQPLLQCQLCWKSLSHRVLKSTLTKSIRTGHWCHCCHWCHRCHLTTFTSRYFTRCFIDANGNAFFNFSLINVMPFLYSLIPVFCFLVFYLGDGCWLCGAGGGWLVWTSFSLLSIPAWLPNSTPGWDDSPPVHFCPVQQTLSKSMKAVSAVVAACPASSALRLCRGSLLSNCCDCTPCFPFR